ncbi:prefoldin subunit alpha [Methermicoccus shengliensis]|uniref:Prefoldin subunit alpha n=1 Tax=Methermicoccus shengliensis TaxID=660064 RepID=A0A832VWQ8_9EURY|nr:prefoldin subunit alpha [Methermicoccus shengliensis]KUK04243.1 MAG: Prefoldin subunit alpha [Euryarchaeota archaeon 55_53]KUK29870.1 MAG: Prefoldin subunit alpha [Methanosarcinales archeaon 56_1174]MDI3488266.1 prefoldin alpha subunit [Methanosarcinales archaeon]MDN5295803.1 prefoldin alpha subunit [Methanosarcinales archaeon]HIH69257.1 prefoldin subunit alpha [Methermicoccus shengliensis]
MVQGEQGEQGAPSKEEISEMYIRYQQLRAQAESMAQQLDILRLSIAELQRAVDGLDALKEKGGAEVLVPVGSGAMMRATLERSDTVVVSIGAGFSIERPLDEARAYLERRKEALSKNYEAGTTTLASITSQMQQIGSVLERYMRV